MLVMCAYVCVFACRHTCVALQIMERILSELEQDHIKLIVDSYLTMLHVLLDSSHSRMRIMAAKSVSRHGLVHTSCIYIYIYLYSEIVARDSGMLCVYISERVARDSCVLCVY